MIIWAIYGDGGFDSRPVETDEYLLMAGLYIEKNPIEAGTAKEGLLVDTDPLYYEMGTTPEERRNHYVELMHSRIEESKSKSGMGGVITACAIKC